MDDREAIARAEALGFTGHTDELGETATLARAWMASRSRHVSYVRMLRRMVAAGINDSTASPAILADAEREFMARYFDTVDDADYDAAAEIANRKATARFSVPHGDERFPG